jgi:phage gpG-like protein
MSDVVLHAARVQAALARQAEALRIALEARIQQKLSGQVLQLRSGALAASIASSIGENGSVVAVSTFSSGVAYAAIQELGGKTAAHEAIAVKAKALAFTAGGGEIFATRAHHPGSTIPARSYLGSSLSDMREDISAGFKQAVIKSLGQA